MKPHIRSIESYQLELTRLQQWLAAHPDTDVLRVSVGWEKSVLPEVHLTEESEFVALYRDRDDVRRRLGERGWFLSVIDNGIEVSTFIPASVLVEHGWPAGVQR
jgi:hypothetical protein